MDLVEMLLNSRRTARVRIGSDVVEIFDRGSERIVKFNGIIYSKLSAKTLYTEGYWDFFAPLGFLWPNPRMLMIGLGGGTVAYQLARLRGGAVDMEAVDVNREMAAIMKEFLGPDTELKVAIADGAEYIKGKRGYNAIILDAYVNEFIPKQFLDREFVSAANEALSDDGILAINYIKSTNGYRNLEGYVELLKSFFKVYSVSVGLLWSNTVIICSKRYGKEEIIERVASSFRADDENAHVISGYEKMTEL